MNHGLHIFVVVISTSLSGAEVSLPLAQRFDEEPMNWRYEIIPEPMKMCTAKGYLVPLKRFYCSYLGMVIGRPKRRRVSMCLGTPP